MSSQLNRTIAPNWKTVRMLTAVGGGYSWDGGVQSLYFKMPRRRWTGKSLAVSQVARRRTNRRKTTPPHLLIRKTATIWARGPAKIALWRRIYRRCIVKVVLAWNMLSQQIGAMLLEHNFFALGPKLLEYNSMKNLPYLSQGVMINGTGSDQRNIGWVMYMRPRDWRSGER